MGKQLKTNNSPWTRVFRRIVQQLRNDPEFKRVVGDRVRSWDGSPGDKNPFTPSEGRPICRLTPRYGNGHWYDPTAQVSTLTVTVELAISSLCIDDPIDLWNTLVSALVPSNAFAQALRDAGAETGEILFSDPAFDPKPDGSADGYFIATGSFKLDVIRSILS